ncbi:prolyl oligopeptidase family serine peptidase [Pacificimonas sp. WHA3]|uniref:Prolyl oligopeptidase family serine peptidase n=1 Tax=Pacificimonas pallii TaxID=2827236 RepID=A0ABS6SF25_9SPHN|nr:prolyl oligopeptidase family serine peptidase [Pacificimonas pallii]MBV7256860.1 prolyl oligopeptidase family serine peptidase [Pacificimonas pallii]
MDFRFSSREEWLDFIASKRGGEEARAIYAAMFTDADFDRWASGTSVVAEKISYQNDGLTINGFAVRPAAPGRYPVIIYNHGGAMQWGRIIFPEILEFHRLARRGYVVLASYYRGEGGSDGEPDMGGGDVSDSLALLDIAGSFAGADTSRVGMIGFSRGGGVTYGAVACSDRVDAAVTIGAPADHLTSARRDEFDEHVYPHAIRGYSEDKTASLRAISALHYAQHFHGDTAMLIVHGGADNRVPPTDSLNLASRLQDAGQPYRLKIYEGGSHGLFENYGDVRMEIDRWMDQYVRDRDTAPGNVPPPLDVD